MKGELTIGKPTPPLIPVVLDKYIVDGKCKLKPIYRRDNGHRRGSACHPRSRLAFKPTNDLFEDAEYALGAYMFYDSFY